MMLDDVGWCWMMLDGCSQKKKLIDVPPFMVNLQLPGLMSWALYPKKRRLMLRGKQ